MGTFNNGIQFIKGVLTNGSQLPGQDYITGLIFYNSSPPAAFPSSGYKECFSPQDAINAGINSNHVGETQAVFSDTLTLTGSTTIGDSISVYMQEPINPTNPNPSPNKILLGQFTFIGSDTITTIATGLKNSINANTYLTGYTATSLVGVLSVTVRPGLGIFPNTGTPLSATVIGSTTLASVWAETTLGVASVLDVYFYHVSEYFRMNPNGQLWIGMYAVPSTYNFNEVQTLQKASGGKLRQIGIYTPARTVVSNSAADIVALNTICQTLDTAEMPLSAVLCEDMSAVTDLTTLPNNSGLNSEWVSTVISQDGNAQGFALYNALGKTVGNLGVILGTISVNQVSADIAQPIPQNNISNQSENQVPALGNGTLFSTLSSGLTTQLDNYRYIYTGTYVGYTGTYFNDSHCCIVQNSNYAWIEQNRVEAKIERLMYLAYLPFLKSQLQLNADGTIFTPLISSLESVGDNALSGMVSANELSQVQTVINPNQNVTNSGKLVVTLNEINNPIARQIQIVVNSVQSITG